MNAWRAGYLAMFLMVTACSGSPSVTPDAGPPATGSGGAPVGGNGGDGSGGEMTAGSGGASGGVTGSGGAAVVDAGGLPETTPPGSDGGGDGAGPPAGNFTCTLVLGAFQTSQWYDGGFETAVGTERWEIKSAHNNWTEKWADANNAIWNLPTQSPCATGATLPDRVILTVYKDFFAPAPAPSVWEPEITKDVANIKTHYPSVKQIHLITLARGPDNMLCPGNMSRNISVAPEIDAAIQAVSDKSGGLVWPGPKYYVPDCSMFMANTTTLIDGAGAKVAPQLIAYYKAHL